MHVETDVHTRILVPECGTNGILETIEKEVTDRLCEVIARLYRTEIGYEISSPSGHVAGRIDYGGEQIIDDKRDCLVQRVLDDSTSSAREIRIERYGMVQHPSRFIAEPFADL